MLTSLKILNVQYSKEQGVFLQASQPQLLPGLVLLLLQIFPRCTRHLSQFKLRQELMLSLVLLRTSPRNLSVHQ
uniref:Uncharacterized protein n=1 Tax=Arundo donax TaxID=35708 RepID=A0A0A9CU62_ARUDO